MKKHLNNYQQQKRPEQELNAVCVQAFSAVSIVTFTKLCAK